MIVLLRHVSHHGCSGAASIEPGDRCSPSDNNGVLISLPTVPNGGSPTVNGSLIFGIGTQSNNGLGMATVYAVPDTGNNAGNFITTFDGNSYPQSFIDSGSNGFFFPNAKGIPRVPEPQQRLVLPNTFAR